MGQGSHTAEDPVLLDSGLVVATRTRCLVHCQRLILGLENAARNPGASFAPLAILLETDHSDRFFLDRGAHSVATLVDVTGRVIYFSVALVVVYRTLL